MPKAIRTHRPKHSTRVQHGTLRERQGNRTLALNGSTWRKLRAVVLREQPMCPACARDGYVTFAKEVDHIDNDPTNNLRSNLVGLCHMHHGQKTRAAAAQRSPATDDARTVLRASRAQPHL